MAVGGAERRANNVPFAPKRLDVLRRGFAAVDVILALGVISSPRVEPAATGEVRPALLQTAEPWFTAIL